MPTPQKKQQPRAQWLQKLLGKGTADEVDTILSDLSRALDGAGVESKAVKSARTKGVMESMQADLKKALTKYVDNPDDVLVNEIIATVLGSMLPTSDDPLDEAVIEEMEDDVEDVPILEEMMEDEEELMLEQDGAMKKQVGYLATIAKEIRTQNEVTNGLVEAITNLANAYKGLNDKVTGIEKKVNATPRRATESKGAIVTDNAVADKMKNASDATQYDDFWGGRKSEGVK